LRVGAKDIVFIQVIMMMLRTWKDSMLPVLVEVRDAGGTNAALAETQKRTNRRDIQVQLQLVTVSHCLHFSESESEDQSNQRFRIIHEEDTVHTLSAVQIVNISFHLFPTPSELEGGPCQ
jgi:hypothetical protein